MTRRLPLALVAVAALVGPLAACSESHGHSDGASSDTPSLPAGEARVIDIAMTEFAFSPSVVEVAEGEKVTLRFHNDGQVVHEAVIADAAAQAAHAEAMTESGGDHEHGMDGVRGLVVLDPGLADGATVVGEDGLLIVCHQPGHEAAGMTAEIVVR